jgi:predicted phosphodiesterase
MISNCQSSPAPAPRGGAQAPVSAVQEEPEINFSGSTPRLCMVAPQRARDTEALPLPKRVHSKDADGSGVHVLTIGDPHFKLDNLGEVSTYIAKIVQIIKNERPDFVVVLGDLLHTHERVHTTVLNKAYQFINRLREQCPVYVLVGNHDYINNSQFLTSNHWMTAMTYWDNVEIIDKGATKVTPFGKFIFCPYVYPGRFIEALTIIDSDWKSARGIFCHQEFYGCKMGAVQSEIGDKWDEQYPYIISGHIHDKQKLQENIYYIGSSMQHAFGESPDKTVTICYFGNNIKMEERGLYLPSKKILYMDMNEIEDFVTPNAIDKFRITLTGNYEAFKVFRKTQKYKKLLSEGVKIVYRPTLAEKDDKPVIRDNFYDLLFALVHETGDQAVMDVYKNIMNITDSRKISV